MAENENNHSREKPTIASTSISHAVVGIFCLGMKLLVFQCERERAACQSKNLHNKLRICEGVVGVNKERSKHIAKQMQKQIWSIS